MLACVLRSNYNVAEQIGSNRWCYQRVSSTDLSNRKQSAFPNTVHGLCYFHLGVLGWLKHVHPYVTKKMKDKIFLRKMVKNIKQWVKSWFYDTESNMEYMFSRHLFFNESKVYAA